MAHSRDILWKDLLEMVFDDLLRFVYPNADEVFDMKRGFVFRDKELAKMYPEPGKKSATRHVDKLASVYRRDGAEEWVLIHLEVQADTKAQDRPLFPERMFRYFTRIFDKHEKPVAAIAIFTGRDGNRMPDKYSYEFMQTSLEYRYKTLRVLDYHDEDLERSKNPFALVLMIAKQALLTGKNLDEKLLAGKLFVFRKLYEQGLFGKKKMAAILTFLNNYVHFENAGTNRIFNTEIDNHTNKKHTMDIFERVAILKVEEKTEFFISNLLKGTKLSMTKIAELAGVSVDAVKEVKADLRKKEARNRRKKTAIAK